MSESVAVMDKKTISITGKRQITIPQKFFESVGFGKEAECILRNNEIVLRPVRESGGEFAEQILADLIAQGLSGDELLNAFKKTQRQIRPAVEKMIEDAGNAAKGIGLYETYDEVFAEE